MNLVDWEYNLKRGSRNNIWGYGLLQAVTLAGIHHVEY